MAAHRWNGGQIRQTVSCGIASGSFSGSTLVLPPFLALHGFEG